MSKEAYCSYEGGFIFANRFTEPITYAELKKRIDDFIEADTYWINHLFTIVENEGLVILPDRDYADYSLEIYDTVGRRVPLLEVEKNLQKYYGKGEYVLVWDYPAKDCLKYTRYEYHGNLLSNEYRYWTSIRNFNQRLKAYIANLEILNNYLKNKK